MFTPYTIGGAITPSDTVAHGKPMRALYVGGAGNVVMVNPDGSTVTLIGALAGNVYPLICKRINATSTTATNLVALW